jgi:hypothetical protein
MEGICLLQVSLRICMCICWENNKSKPCPESWNCCTSIVHTQGSFIIGETSFFCLYFKSRPTLYSILFSHCSFISGGSSVLYFLEVIYVEIKKRLLAWKVFLLISSYIEYENQNTKKNKTVICCFVLASNIVRHRKEEGYRLKVLRQRPHIERRAMLKPIFQK